MKIKDQDAWAEWVANNQDGYGSGVIRFAERWADLMEARIATGAALADVAQAASHEADTEGITGFMYGAAVAVLASSWERGEELRRWHNLDAQIGSEGERANESGGVLNPALLNLGPSEDLFMTPDEQLDAAIRATRARLVLLEQLRDDNDRPTRADLGWMAVGLVAILCLGVLQAVLFGAAA